MLKANLHLCVFFSPHLHPQPPGVPLQTGLVPFHVRSLVQLSTDTLCDSIMWPGTHWYVTVLLYLKSLPSRMPLAGIPGSPQFMTRVRETQHCSLVAQALGLFSILIHLHHSCTHLRRNCQTSQGLGTTGHSQISLYQSTHRLTLHAYTMHAIQMHCGHSSYSNPLL